LRVESAYPQGPERMRRSGREFCLCSDIEPSRFARKSPRNLRLSVAVTVTENVREDADWSRECNQERTVSEPIQATPEGGKEEEHCA
jgi:hypothetical protein